MVGILRCAFISMNVFNSMSLVLVVGLMAISLRTGIAQEIPLAPPPGYATSAERLLMEQVEQLIAAGEFNESLVNLDKLYEAGANSLVQRGATARHGSLWLQRYVPLRDWCREQSRLIIEAHAAVATDYKRRVDGAASAALASLQADKDPIEIRRVADRYSLSSNGEDLRLLLTDSYLEKGWGLAAASELNRLEPQLHRSPKLLGGKEGNMDASNQSVDLSQQAQPHDQQFAPRGQGASTVRTLAIAKRLLAAAAMQPETLDRKEIESSVRSLASRLAAEQQQELLEALQAFSQPSLQRSDDQWLTFANDNWRSGKCSGRFDLSAWPTWQQQLESYSTNSDRTSASKPRVGETNRGSLPYHPVVYDGKVFINEMIRVRAYDLASGKPWPEAQPALPLFDSHLSSAAYVPLGYPLVGVARGTITISDGCLYARLGSPVTGWANRESAPDGSSLSYLIGLDLERQGKLLRGFPLRLEEPEFSEAEFEGCPLVWGDLLMVAIVERDNVGVRRSVIACDRFSGQLVWRSGVLGAGTVDGSDRANLITHQLLSFAGGRLYYNTNLGSIVCLDPLTGNTEWLVRYARFEKTKQAYPSPDRFRYRDLTPCLIAKGRLYCMPQDCPELFAIDVISGEILWASEAVQAADAIHLLGTYGDSLVVSGDRLLWLDRRTGRPLAGFPGNVTPGVVNALPSPRGLGRGAVIGDEVYWPSAGEVFVFDADMSHVANPSAPPIKRRMQMGSLGSGGGNLCVAAQHLIMTTPGRLMVYREIP